MASLHFPVTERILKKKTKKPNMSKHRTVAQLCCSAFINMERVKSQNVFSPSKWCQRLCDRAAGSSPLPVFNHPTCGRQPDSSGLLKGLLFPPRYSKRLISCLKWGTAQQTTRKEDYRPSFCLTFASQWGDSSGLSTSTATGRHIVFWYSPWTKREKRRHTCQILINWPVER